MGGGSSPCHIGRDQAMAIPAFAACVNAVAGTVASLPVRLYRTTPGGWAEEVKDDRRVRLLNGDTGDTLTAPEMKRALVEDYYTSDKGGTAFINRLPWSNEVESLNYVRPDAVAILSNEEEPIFKRVEYLIAGKRYQDMQVLRILRATKDGRRGRSVVSANRDALSVAYQTMLYEQSLVRRGGNKRGFLQAPREARDLGAQGLEEGVQGLLRLDRRQRDSPQRRRDLPGGQRHVHGAPDQREQADQRERHLLDVLHTARDLPRRLDRRGVEGRAGRLRALLRDAAPGRLQGRARPRPSAGEREGRPLLRLRHVRSSPRRT